MRIISKYHKLNRHNLQARLKTASHRFALMVDNYSPDDTEAENGLLMVTGKVFVPGYTDATVTIVYPKRKRATDQSFYYITPTESTEDMSLAYSDDTFYPRFSECEQAVKDLPEVTVSEYFYDKGIIPDDPSTFTALTGIPLESQLVEDINTITGEDTNYYIIGADPHYKSVDEIIKQCTNYQDGDKIIPYLDITSYFFNNGEPTSNFNTLMSKGEILLTSPSDFYNSLTIILRQPSEHPELNTQNMSAGYDNQWVLTITSTFTSEIKNRSLWYTDSYNAPLNFRDDTSYYIYEMTQSYMRSLFSSLDEWASLVINGVLHPYSQNSLSKDLMEEYHNVCAEGNPWTDIPQRGEFTIETRDLEGFTPVEGLGNGVFHFVLASDALLSESLSHFTNPSFLNENPNDNQLYLTSVPHPDLTQAYDPVYRNQYSTVYFASNKRGREIVFLHLPDTLMSGCLDNAPSWTTLNYLKTQGQQLMSCLQETIMSLNNNNDDTEPGEIEDTSNDLMSRLVALGWEQSSPTTILSPSVDAPREYDHTSVKLQFTCIDNTWSLSSLIVSCEATGGEVPLPLSDTQLNDGVTSENIAQMLEEIANHGNPELGWNDFGGRNTSSGNLLANGSTHDNDRGLALYAARLLNRDIYVLSTVDPEFKTGIPYEDIEDVEYTMEDDPQTVRWVYRILEAFNLPHSFEISDNFNTGSGYLTLENKDYTILFNKSPEEEEPALSVAKYFPNRESDIVPPEYSEYYALWSDLFNGTPYADFSTILPGVGAALTVLYVFSQPLLNDPQIINNIQRIMNREFDLERSEQKDEDYRQDAVSWFNQVSEVMNQSQIFTQKNGVTWSRDTNPIVINGVNYSQQVEGHIEVRANNQREEMEITPLITMVTGADNTSQYVNSLMPPSLNEVLTRGEALWSVSAEKVNTLIGHDVLNGVSTVEQLTALEENTNDVLPWLSNSSAQQVKNLQNAAGWVQYCDKILNNEEIPSLDFIKQGLHGNILNLLRKNNISGTTGINDFLMSIGAVPLNRMDEGYMLSAVRSNHIPFIAYDVCKYYAVPVIVNGWNNLYCALTFTKQNGKPVCRLQDDYLYMTQEKWGGMTFLQVASANNAHLTTLGETFNSLVTGAGMPDYNLLHFLQDQLSNGLGGSDAAVQALEENKKYIDIHFE